MPLTPEQEVRRRLLFAPCVDKQALHDWIFVFLDVDLPDVVVDDRSNCTPLQMIWDIYSHFMHPPANQEELPAERLYYANRFGGKTLAMAITEVLALLHVNTNVVHLASIEEQSVDAQNYLKGFFLKPDLQGFVEGDSVRKTEVVYFREPGGLYLTRAEHREAPDQGRYEAVVNKAEVVVATMSSVNGKHAGLMCLDEFDLVRDPRIVAESKNIPTPIRRPGGAYVLPLTVITSTRKTAIGPVQKAIDRASETGLLVKHWNIMSTTQRCPPERHRPDLPRLPIYRSDRTLRAVDEATYNAMDEKARESYVRDEGFTGCLQNCKIFAACKGRLATCQTSTAAFLKPVSDTALKFRTNELDTAISQLVCLKPSSVGLIYGSLMEDRHVISPAQAYRMVAGADPPSGPVPNKAALVDALRTHEVRWFGGQDYGYEHFFAFVVGFRFGLKFFVTRAPAAAELDPAQQLSLCAPLKALNPVVYGDTAYPGTVAWFKKHGWAMRDWKKGPGTVNQGIGIVRGKLSPMSGDPELLFVREDDQDPEIDLLLQHLKEYSWKLDAAGKPTDDPDDDNDDLPDALRYAVMNVFPHRRGGVTTGQEAQAPSPEAPRSQAQGGQQKWMRDVIDGMTEGGTPGGSGGSPGGGKGRLKWSI